MNKRDIVVIGGSAGGLQALKQLCSALPKDFPASVLAVLHMSPHCSSQLAAILRRTAKLEIIDAVDRLRLEQGTVYVCVPDRHLLVEDGTIRLAHGAKENHSRPAIDALFRSAALAHGSRVVGVLLSGWLSDGTAGLLAIKRAGGVAIVQDPAEAAAGDMPMSALRNVEVDHCGGVQSIASLLVTLATDPVPEAPVLSDSAGVENRIAKGDVTALADLERIGTPSVLTCPECQGTLLELPDPALRRFRCQAGHAYSAETLLSDQLEGLDRAASTLLRALDECLISARDFQRRAIASGDTDAAARYQSMIGRLEKQARVVRDMQVGEPLVVAA